MLDSIILLVGPKSVLLAEATVQGFGFSNYGFLVIELKFFCDKTDTLSPVSNSAVVVHYYTVMEYSVLVPSKETSLMATSISLNSQSTLEDMKSEH